MPIAAAANPEGHLYGSVGPREIAAALRDAGHAVDTAQIQMHETIKELDSRMVPVRFGENLEVEVKVWVVREKAAGDLDEEEQAPTDEEPAEGPDAADVESEET